MKVLITGGAGFLGSNLVDHLLCREAQVLVIDNFATGRKDSLQKSDHLTIVEGTIANGELVDNIFCKFQPTHVIHSAASYKNPLDWQEDIKTNILGTAYVVQAAQRLRVRRFIYLQTALCYGRPQENPITLGHPLSPFTSYAVSKTAGENYVVFSGLSYVSLRLANIYGPRHFSGPMPTFYKRLKAGQRCLVVDTRRDFLEVEDFLRLMEEVMKEDGPVGCFNVSSGKDCGIKDIFAMLTQSMKISPDGPVDLLPSGEDDVASLLLDPSETERAFGWKARIPLDEGINRLIRWYEIHGVDNAYTHLQVGSDECK